MSVSVRISVGDFVDIYYSRLDSSGLGEGMVLQGNALEQLRQLFSEHSGDLQEYLYEQAAKFLGGLADDHIKGDLA